MTERQKFQLIKKLGAIEIREYLPCVMADVLVKSEYGNAGNMGFRPLVTYISQNNIAMTAPVIQEESAEGGWIVSFVMPAEKELSQMPIPKNSQVTLRQSPRYKAAVLPFSGITTWQKVQSKERELREIMQREGLSPGGTMQVARFDPPWKPGFMRHNEIIIPIN